MKFGKVAEYNLDPTWSPYFLNYKALSKAIFAEKRYRVKNGKKFFGDEFNVSGDMAFEDRNLFQTLFDVEVAKVNNFYQTKVITIRQEFQKLSNKGFDQIDSEDEETKTTCWGYLCGKRRMITHRIYKTDICHVYKECDSLKNFSQLNFLAIKKILEKYDRHLNTKEKEKRIELVKSMEFFETQAVQEYLGKLEILYAECFTGGNTTKAIKFLRPRKLRYSELFSGGVMVGFTGPLFIMLIIFCICFGNLAIDNTRLINILPVYRATGLPIIFIWIWAILIIAWQRHGINYVYILQLKSDSIATYMDILKIASFFSLLWLSSFIIFLGMENDWFTIFKHEHFPSSMPALILVVIMIVALIFPFNIFYRETRIGMLFSLWNILISPVVCFKFKGLNL